MGYPTRFPWLRQDYTPINGNEHVSERFSETPQGSIVLRTRLCNNFGRSLTRRGFALFILFVTIIGFAVFLVFLPYFQPHIHSFLGLRTTPHLFDQHIEYEDISHEADFLWENLFPPNGGFLVQDVDGKKVNFGISMFHQLHCLQMLRTRLQSSATEQPQRDHFDGNDSLGKPPSTHQHGPDPNKHLYHCLDYLRQGIMCYADASIEQPKFSNEMIPIDGYPTMHQCGNKDALYALSINSGSVDDY